MSWEESGEVVYASSEAKWPEMDEVDPPIMGTLSTSAAAVLAASVHAIADAPLNVDHFRPARYASVLASVRNLWRSPPSTVYASDFYRAFTIETPTTIADLERRLAVVEQELRDVKQRIKSEGKVAPFDSIDFSATYEAFDVADKQMLEDRVRVRPSLQRTLVRASDAIRTLFPSCRPKLQVEMGGRINLLIPTELEPEEASNLYDRLLVEWWRSNVSVEDKLSFALDFI